MAEKNGERVSLPSEEALRRWLARQQIDASSWGHDGAKRPSDLWEELRSGDCQLQEDPPLRVIKLVEIIIRRGERILMERAQELTDGSRRARDIPPSEKMRPHEDVETAALRGLEEELQVSPSQVLLEPNTIQRRQRQADSPSFPGLPTQYTIYSIEAMVADLPEAPFWRDNGAFNHGDPVRRQLWAWERLGEDGKQ